MAISFAFYTDPALTTPVNAALPFVQSTTPTAVDRVLWFGSRLAGRVARLEADPGAGQIVITPTGPGAGDVRLALTAGGLAAATPGAALSLGTEVAGGLAGAVAVHVRVLDTSGLVGARAFAVGTASLAEYAL